MSLMEDVRDDDLVISDRIEHPVVLHERSPIPFGCKLLPSRWREEPDADLRMISFAKAISRQDGPR